MDTERFAQLVDEAVASIPEYFRSRFENISIDIQPLASADIARSVGKHPWNLLGIYQGVPYPQRRHWYGNVLPDRILIFQSPIERFARTAEAIRHLVRRVVIHEVGHYFGLSDIELSQLEREADEAERAKRLTTRPPEAASDSPSN